MEENNTQKGKTLRGTVVTDSRENTTKVAVSRFVMHPKYKKFMKQVKKFLVHDPENSAAIGDKVVIRESRPISKRKNFVIESNESTEK